MQADTPTTVTVPAEDLEYSWPFGKQHKRSRVIIASVLLLAAIGAATWMLMEYQVRAVAWHLRHGNSFTYEGVKFHIPMLEYARCWAPGNCVIMRHPNRIFARLSNGPSALWVSLRPRDPRGDALMDQKRAHLFTWTLVGEREVDMAGTRLHCDEYLQPNKYNHTISCFADDSPFVITSMGTPDASWRLYELLGSAERE